MYKKQMKFQKIICYVVLIASALAFFYSLGLLTDLYDSLYSMMPDPSEPSLDRVAGARIFYDMQDFNMLFTKVTIVLILLGVFNLVMNTHTRRRYYIGNYVSIALCTAGSIAASIWARGRIMDYKEQYLTGVDFEKLKTVAERRGTYYTESTFWFDVSGFVLGFVILAAVLLAANLIWKIIVTKKEKALIKAGKEAA
ncbi:MAG: hypothetical protein K6F16_01920 [Lachnospiraceae bacterium]|nr:hypothetical protein [Lachnospiraceae bacterium]